MLEKKFDQSEELIGKEISDKSVNKNVDELKNKEVLEKIMKYGVINSDLDVIKYAMEQGVKLNPNWVMVAAGRNKNEQVALWAKENGGNFYHYEYLSDCSKW